METVKYVFKIVNVFFEITSACNGNCFYCYNHSGQLVNQLPCDLINQLVKEAHESNKDATFTISGGEPFLHDKLLDIVDYIQLLGHRVLINTNASFLDKYYGNESLKKCNFQVTLESADRDEHDSYRGLNSFRNISKLRAYVPSDGKSTVDMRINISKKNYHSIDKFLKLAQDWGYDSISFGFLVPYGRAANSGEIIDAHHNREVYNETVSYLEECRRSKRYDVAIELANCYPKVGCNLIALGNLTISPRVCSNGDVYPCLLCDGEEFVVGNVHGTTLGQILEGDSFQALISRFIERSKTLDGCQSCAWKTGCFKGCPAIAHQLYGTLDADTGSCDFLKNTFLNARNRG